MKDLDKVFIKHHKIRIEQAKAEIKLYDDAHLSTASLRATLHRLENDLEEADAKELQEQD